MYLNMLSDLILSSVMSADDTFLSFFQQDGPPPHYGLGVRTYIDKQFAGRGIGRRGPTEWPARSPEVVWIFLLGRLKAKVYSEKIRDVRHLEQRILAVCEEISPDILIRVMNSWVDRLNRCLAQQRAHIEHLMKR
jgi:hypothetical protein